MADFRETVALSVGTLCEAFNRQPSEATIQAYIWGLDGLAADEVQRATMSALQKCKFMPTPSELRELATTDGEPPETRAAKAFYAVSRAVGRFGYRQSVDFDDPLVNATIHHLGGWGRFCGSDPEEFDKWLRKDFMATYAAFLKSPPSPEACGPCIGELGARPNVVETGLTLGPVQQQIAMNRAISVDVPLGVPRVEFKKP